MTRPNLCNIQVALSVKAKKDVFFKDVFQLSAMSMFSSMAPKPLFCFVYRPLLPPTGNH